MEENIEICEENLLTYRRVKITKVINQSSNNSVMERIKITQYTIVETKMAENM